MPAAYLHIVFIFQLGAYIFQLKLFKQIMSSVLIYYPRLNKSDYSLAVAPAFRSVYFVGVNYLICIFFQIHKAYLSISKQCAFQCFLIYLICMYYAFLLFMQPLIQDLLPIIPHYHKAYKSDTEQKNDPYHDIEGPDITRRIFLRDRKYDIPAVFHSSDKRTSFISPCVNVAVNIGSACLFINIFKSSVNKLLHFVL